VQDDVATPREVIDDMKDAIRAADPARLCAWYAEDALMVIPHAVHRGKDELLAYWQKDLATYTQTTIDFRLRTEWGDTAIDEWTMESLNTTNGQREALRGVDIAVLSGGLVVEHRWYYDT
jgi:uncharacterized protein (TIGR02246 family)